jgi:AraC-like DNA-binding protein
MQKPASVMSVCVFFPVNWASEVLRGCIEADDILLDDPFRQNTVNFFETLQHHGDVVSPYMRVIKNLPHEVAVINASPYEEFLRDLLAAMLQTQRNIAKDAEKLPDARLATRLELFRRLSIARDYLHASYFDDLSIDELANVAGLSPYHFIRKFKAVFGSTPHQYLQQIRLEHAQNLLSTTDTSVTDICFAVGFQSLGSFSTLFQKQVGVSPRTFRKPAS